MLEMVLVVQLSYVNCCNKLAYQSQAHHQSVLEAELQHAVVSVDNGCPYFQSSTDVRALHHHAQVARRNKEATGDKTGL